MSILKEIFELEASLKYLILNGINLISEDLEKSPPFDSNKPYDEKNKYISRANKVGLLLIQEINLPALAEIYYTRLLETILDYEENTKKIFNKGIVYANLGVSLAAQGNIDDGFAYILKAHEEDLAFHKQGYEPAFLGSPLYQQFERKVAEFMEKNAQKSTSITVSRKDVASLLSTLDVDNRLFLIGVVWNIARNLFLFGTTDNSFTRGRLFSSIKDVCLFVEDALRRKLKPTGRTMLKNLLDLTFLSEPWKTSSFDPNYSLASSNDVTEFESNLNKISSINDSSAKMFLYLAAIRNFSGHHFSVSSSFFFSNFREILQHVISALFFLYCTGKI